LEKKNNVLFYKCVCFTDDQKWKEDFKLNTMPAFVFLHNGKELGRLDKLNETDPDYIDVSKLGEENADEKAVKDTIKDFCRYVSENRKQSE
jgi:hypothetical protein